MTRFITPIILIIVSVVIFLVFTNPMFGGITELRGQTASYNEALANSKMLENERDKLTAKYNSMNPDNLAKLQKLLPKNVDNIRLILEIEQIAMPYGMVLRNVKYNSTEENAESDATGAIGVVRGGGVGQIPNKDYGIWDLEFSTSGTYNNFLNFTRDLENNLRIVDISSIQFSTEEGGNAKFTTTTPNTYQFNFKIRTYWLKN